MLDLMTLELTARELFVLDPSALTETIAIGCTTAEAGCPNSNPLGVRLGKTLGAIEYPRQPEVQGLELACVYCQVW